MDKFLVDPVQKLMETQKFTRQDSLQQEDVKFTRPSPSSKNFKKPEANATSALTDSDGGKEFTMFCMIILNIRNLSLLILICHIAQIFILKSFKDGLSLIMCIVHLSLS